MAPNFGPLLAAMRFVGLVFLLATVEVVVLSMPVVSQSGKPSNKSESESGNFFVLENSDKICSVMGFDQPYHSGPCGKIVLLAGVLEATAKFGDFKCQAEIIKEAVAVSKAGESLPYPLRDLRPVKMTIPASTWMQEAANYYWMYRTLINFEIWAPCDVVHKGELDLPVPSGWTHQGTIYVDETKNGDLEGFDKPGNTFKMPFASVMTRENMMVILVKGTQSAYEWMIDFDYAFTDMDKVDPKLQGAGRSHAGFSIVALEIFDSLKPILDEQVVMGRIFSVAIAGHSLGAGVSSILSYLVQMYINKAVPGLDRIKVDAFLFAPPNAGNKQFNEILAQKVNLRSISFKYDIVTKLPCVPLMMACKNQFGIGHVPNTEGNPPREDWPYRSQFGEVKLEPSQYPQSSAWSCFKDLDTRKIASFLLATHICSYMCVPAQYVNDTENWCMLSSEGADTEASSFCQGFPAGISNVCDV